MALPNDPSLLVEGLNQVPKQEFLSALSRVYEGHGTAIVFIEQHILSALSRLGIATWDFGRDKGFVGVFPLQNDINYVSADNVVYILNPDLSSMRSVVVHLLSYTQRFVNAKPTILYVPQKTLIAEQVMEDEFKLSHTFPNLRIASLDLDYVFLEEKFFTMALPLSFKSVFADGDLSNLTWIARLLLKLQTARFGAIRHIRGKGSNAARVVQLLQRMQNYIGHDFVNDIPSEVETLIIIDRSVDFVTPLMTQLTYEGLIDELYGIENCEVQFPFSLGESSGVGASERVALNSTDRMFAEIRDKSFTGVGSVLYQKSLWVKQNYDKRKEVQQLKELKEFMKGLPEMQEMHRLIGIHTNVATEISKTTQSTDFRKRILFEHNIIQQINEGDALKYVEDLVFRKEKFEIVVRLLALLSLVYGGLREKDLLGLKENMMLAYGIPHVITTFFLLERCGLLCAQSGKGSSYPAIRKQLQIWNSSLTEEQPNDIAYAYGGYAPPLVRMVDTLLRNPKAWDAENDAPSLLPGAKKELVNDVEIAGTAKTAIVFVIGGITASEVSALRFVEEQLSSGGRPHRIFIGTTDLISGNRMIRSLLPFEPTR
ncbi:vacuolar protein sorting-like protein [Leishmania mexicana MHOM/GT/2001/U1103]|uniref:Vacuolar protein sorting-like protein n=1 Tax=Leishmania mexicana (strain MHOM/GT/2001/U1103) TaxID=929439 RepID=E9AXV2_LEIMU|nr:vacuolar protein sorting-like protein [Leishmania mexicana MHOM/GT/2001/U1103]CBZ27794.1 vacuolar protein sorting-like protein [Leishmania mexicana MHOM/GT/2001/U1103]